MARLLLLPLLAPAACAVQVDVLTLPNYQRYPLGEIGAVEGGAVAARGGASGSAWYNPASLANLERPSVSGSVNALEYQRSTSVAEGGVARTDTINVIPTHVAVCGRSEGGSVPLGWTLAMATPINWEANAEVQHSPDPANQDVSNASSKLRVLVPWFGVGAALDPRWRVGGGLQVMIADYSYISGSVASSGALRQVDTYQETGRAWQWRAVAGCQVSGDSWSAGLSGRTPSITFSSAGRLRSSTLRAGGATTEMTTVFDDGPGFEFKQPWSLTGGAALRMPEWDFEIEADCTLYAPIATYDVFRESRGTTVSTPGSEVPFSVLARTTGNRFVANPAGALAWYPGTLWGHRVGLHAGAYWDRSPVANSDTFSRLDQLGFTGGASFTRFPTSLTIGGGFITSSSPLATVAYLRSPQSGLDPSSNREGAQFATRTFLLLVGTTYLF